MEIPMHTPAHAAAAEAAEAAAEAAAQADSIADEIEQIADGGDLITAIESMAQIADSICRAEDRLNAITEGEAPGDDEETGAQESAAREARDRTIRAADRATTAIAAAIAAIRDHTGI